MRAAVLHTIGDEKLDIRDDVTVLGPGPGEVRLRVRAAGVCHSDLSALRGALPQPVPAVLGHEAAGDVIEVGDGVDDLAPGDRVAVNWLPACGVCTHCRRGEDHLCMTHVMAGYVIPRFAAGDLQIFGMAGCGSFAEEMVVPRAGAVKIDDDVPYEVAALVGCGVTTGVGAVINTARVRPGDSVVVIGCGGVGIAAIQGARLAGAAHIMAVDTVPARHEAARRFGATHTATPDELGDLQAEVMPEGFDHAFDVVAVPQTLRTAWSATRRGGQVVVVGAGRAEDTVEFSPFELLFEGKTIIGSLYGSADPHRDFPRLLALWRAGRLDIDGMISRRLRLDQAGDALAALGSGDVIRQVIIND
ncbi:alcohol dehydrogenase catalytic domain-containing protein [Actinoplanes xinjiangensis]|jgi:S-(hydroxymethyl)glutathione dehydrogenase/alcohol dehydrogenase|uniref:S-(Hydroxymethyl)glutathione dehydrogenase/alcohol dehydrogenase n=1 Tax=Actinoplanes xinjiangensis TaxID=512350 RepID=A0A316G333_9ACTN|nr:alcohol dehydrogenase catalytic domain-containing protein [Actinoplanes xinjiangensis]PWK48797.1 S-(hydroxymethyl)glutathione dehydrogenase/alcohol dehydrogenase [Actinoplanes xinjiangensis]GIF38504.1 alcohol dehydrogenase [Actinoplanes xinjiangensis]